MLKSHSKFVLGSVFFLLVFLGCSKQEAPDFFSLPRNIRTDFDFAKTERMLDAKKFNCHGYQYHKRYSQNEINITLVFVSHDTCKETAYLVTIDKKTLEIQQIKARRVKH